MKLFVTDLNPHAGDIRTLSAQREQLSRGEEEPPGEMFTRKAAIGLAVLLALSGVSCGHDTGGNVAINNVAIHKDAPAEKSPACEVSIRVNLSELDNRKVSASWVEASRIKAEARKAELLRALVPLQAEGDFYFSEQGSVSANPCVIVQIEYLVGDYGIPQRTEAVYYNDDPQGLKLVDFRSWVEGYVANDRQKRIFKKQGIHLQQNPIGAAEILGAITMAQLGRMDAERAKGVAKK